jgi:N-acetylglucosaminyldiphosphoundecaprenol N-acetyl-beta-D-mannosaminyltransferase
MGAARHVPSLVSGRFSAMLPLEMGGTLEPDLVVLLDQVEATEPCARCAVERTLVTINSVAFDVLTERALSEAIARFRDCGNSHAAHFLAAHPTVVARQLPAYGDLLRGSDLVVADGTPIALTMLVKDRRSRRVTATDGFYRVCRDGISSELRHYFVGGANDAVARAICANLNASFPGIRIVGFTVPPFRPYTDDEFRDLISSIRVSEPDVVWVGLGAPKQEVLAHRLRAANAGSAIVTIGATFDFVAGTKRRAPRLLRATGLEWLFRVTLEPRRLWRRYLIGNAQFVAGVVSDSVRRRS